MKVNGSDVALSRGSGGNKTYSGISDALCQIHKDSGVRGLYRGAGTIQKFLFKFFWGFFNIFEIFWKVSGPTLLGILPYAGLKFYVYERLKGGLSTDEAPTITMKLTCGAIAGLIGQTLTYPLDVVRRQMQVQIPFFSQPIGEFQYVFEHHKNGSLIFSPIRFMTTAYRVLANPRLKEQLAV